MRPFYLSLHVRDLAAARDFYVGLLGCCEGRSTTCWVDFEFFGHQLSLHLGDPAPTQLIGEVEGVRVPLLHFGAILGWGEFDALAARLRAAGVAFIIPPQVRFAGAPGEQATMFFLDPSGNAIELKAFRDPSQVFVR